MLFTKKLEKLKQRKRAAGSNQIRYVLVFINIRVGRSTCGGVNAHFGPSRGLMTQIFVFADVEFGVRKYKTKKYEPSA